MKLLAAAYYEFKKNIRDIKMIAFILFFPIMATYILGNAVGNFFENDTASRIKIGYVNMDNGKIGKEFDSFLQSKEIQKRLSISDFNSKKEGQEAIEKGRVDSVIYIPEALSEDIQKGNKKNIELYGKKNIEFVESLTRGFVSGYNTLSAVIISGGKPDFAARESSIKRIFYTKNARTPRMIDYYAVLELLMIIIIGAMFGVAITTKDEATDMHIRIHSLPIRKASIVFGRVLGSSIFLFLCSIVVMMFTKFVYHVNWNGNMVIILGTLFTVALIVVGLGVLIGALVPGFGSSLMIVLLLLMIFGVVSGAISPVSTNNVIAMFTPNYHAKVLIFGSIYGYSKEIMLQSALWLLGMLSVIYLMVAAFIGRGKYGNI